MADMRTERNHLLKCESRIEGELERNLDDNIDNKLDENLNDKLDGNLDNKLDGNLDDKAGQVVRYATLSLLYLVQVKASVSRILVTILTCYRVLPMASRPLVSPSCSDSLASPSLASLS